MLPFFMHGDGFILSEEDLKRYNGHHQIDKYYLAEGADKPTIEEVPPNANINDIKEWLRPTQICEGDVERWKATPALRILMIKTQNEFSRNPEGPQPTHRTIPGETEVTKLPNQEQHVKMVQEIFRHARLPLAAIGAYVKSQITFLSAPSYEVFGDEGTSGGEVTKYYCSGTSWSIAWSYFHATRHTAAVLFYREGDGVLRRGELEHEMFRLKRHVAHPLLIAYIKTQISLVWTFRLLEQMNGQTFEIEKSVGLATWDWVLDREIAAYHDPNIDEPDSEENVAKAQKKAVERYNVLSGKLINIRFRLRSFKEQIVWLKRMNDTYCSSLTTRECCFGDPASKIESRQRECKELDMILDRMDDFNKVYLHDAETLADRLTQQMASMSQLIMQRDSRISLEIADINNELAWQGKNTSHAMMAIAVASFVFLPGTFIASIFDTPIFQWTPRDDHTIVTEPFLIFWITSGLTTALLSLCWWLYLRRRRAYDEGRQQESRRDFRKRISRTPTFSKKLVSEAVRGSRSNDACLEHSRNNGGGFFAGGAGRCDKIADEEKGI